MNKNIFILFFVFILLVPIIYSVKPTQVFTGDTGIEIRIPPAEFVPQNMDAQLNVQIYNLSDGHFITNESADCFFNLFNRSGHHQFDSQFEYDSVHDDFQLDVGAGNFSVLGFHSFLIECNMTHFGGFVSGGFEVTKTGNEEIFNGTSSIMVIVFVLLLTGSLFFLGIKKDFTKNPIANIIIKRCIIIFGMLLVSLDTAMVLTIADNAFLGVNRELFRYLWIINWTIYFSMLALAWNTLISILGMWETLKNQKRMGSSDGFK